MLIKAFIEAQFGYCPLAWMCYNRSCNNNRLNHLHERALRIFYNENVLSFRDLQRDQSVSIHHSYICLLGIELPVQNHKQYF